MQQALGSIVQPEVAARETLPPPVLDSVIRWIGDSEAGLRAAGYGGMWTSRASLHCFTTDTLDGDALQQLQDALSSRS